MLAYPIGGKNGGSALTFIVVQKDNFCPTIDLRSSLRNHSAMPTCTDDDEAAHFAFPLNFSMVA